MEIKKIKFNNYCEHGNVSLALPGNSSIEELDGELLPCPICGRIPELMVMPVPGETDVVTASVNCHGGRNLSHAYVQTNGSGYYRDVLVSALKRWNSGEITYFEHIERAFRSCYTCKKFCRENGQPDGTCEKDMLVAPGSGCECCYEKLDSAAFRESLTR